jgi:hypothetical protein
MNSASLSISMSYAVPAALQLRLTGNPALAYWARHMKSYRIQDTAYLIFRHSLESRGSVWGNSGGFEPLVGSTRQFSYGAGSFQGPGIEVFRLSNRPSSTHLRVFGERNVSAHIVSRVPHAHCADRFRLVAPGQLGRSTLTLQTFFRLRFQDIPQVPLLRLR